MNQYATVLTYPVNIPAATALGYREIEIDTPADYKTLRGYYVIRNQGTDYIEFGVKTKSTVLTDPVNLKHYEVADGGVKIKDKFYEDTPAVAGGKKLIISIKTFTNSAIQDFTFVMKFDNGPLTPEK